MLLDAATLDARRRASASQTPVTSVVRVEGPAEPTLYATTGERLMRVEVKNGQSPHSVAVRRLDAGAGARPRLRLRRPSSSTCSGDAVTATVRPSTWSSRTPTRLRRCRRSPPRRSPGRSMPMPIARPRIASSCWPSRRRARCPPSRPASNAFGWRFPGVILGALTAALLYLLARVLFRRREVGIAVAAAGARRRHDVRPDRASA